MFWILIQSESSKVDDPLFGAISGTGDTVVWQTKICPDCKRPIEIKQVGNLEIELMGSELEDFVWLDDPSIIVSERLKSILKNSNLSGFLFREVEIVYWWYQGDEQYPLEDAPPLYQLVITGRGGSMLPQNKLAAESECKTCCKTRYKRLEDGIFVDENKWDGSDAFYLDEFPGYSLFTDRFIGFLEKNDITGYTAVAADTYPLHRFSV